MSRESAEVANPGRPRTILGNGISGGLVPAGGGMMEIRSVPNQMKFHPISFSCFPSGLVSP